MRSRACYTDEFVRGVVHVHLLVFFVVHVRSVPFSAVYLESLHPSLVSTNPLDVAPTARRRRWS